MFFDLNLHTEVTNKRYKWKFKNYPHIKVTECGKVVNTKTGRKKKVCVNGYSKGVWITSTKFLTNLNNHIIKIE